MVKKYRKKPVIIEAMQVRRIDSYSAAAVTAWCSSAYVRASDGHLVISTLEGEMTVSAGDYIIKGVQGEFYPCKPDIFAATYDNA
tara:strand:- start:1740 stop:1994 length:255 start_codon:yes stop_codon:yes gene_type:complete